MLSEKILKAVELQAEINGLENSIWIFDISHASNTYESEKDQKRAMVKEKFAKEEKLQNMLSFFTEEEKAKYEWLVARNIKMKEIKHQKEYLKRLLNEVEKATENGRYDDAIYTTKEIEERIKDLSILMQELMKI